MTAVESSPIELFAFVANDITNDEKWGATVDSRTALRYCVPSRDAPSIDGPVDQSSGQQLWECAIDLVEYLASDDTLDQPARRVLELGCGHGLPGTWCLTHRNAATVVFQDRNAAVLRNITMRTLALNCDNAELLQRAQFVSGDWRELALRDDVFEPRFDLVLAAECLYSHESTAAFVCALRRVLANDGTALIATKTLYFGIGGGSLAFRRAIAESEERALRDGSGGDRILHVEQLREYADGKSNVRELLKVTWKSR